MTLTQPLSTTLIPQPFPASPGPWADEPSAAHWRQRPLDGHSESVLRRSALLKNLSPDVAQALAGEFETATAARTSTLFAEGDPADHLYVVLSGKIKLIRHAGDGREKLVDLLGPSDQFGDVSLLDSTPRTATAVVVTDARLARLSKAALHEWIARHPQLATQLLRVVAHRLRRTHADLSNLVFVDTSGRVATELLRLAQRFGVPYHDEVRIEHDLTQTELAQLVGASRETINKILSNYATRGWVRLETKCVVILDHERLAQRACPQTMPTQVALSQRLPVSR